MFLLCIVINIYIPIDGELIVADTRPVHPLHTLTPYDSCVIMKN